MTPAPPPPDRRACLCSNYQPPTAAWPSAVSFAPRHSGASENQGDVIVSEETPTRRRLPRPVILSVAKNLAGVSVLFPQRPGLPNKILRYAQNDRSGRLVQSWAGTGSNGAVYLVYRSRLQPGMVVP